MKMLLLVSSSLKTAAETIRSLFPRVLRNINSGPLSNAALRVSLLTVHSFGVSG